MTTPAPTDDELLRERRLQRNLKILVSVLGALIVLGIAAVGWRATHVATAPAPPTTPSSGQSSGPSTAALTTAGDVLLELPKGAKVTAVSISGNRLAITHESSAGTGIAVLDLDTGRRLTNIKTIEAVPRN